MLPWKFEYNYLNQYIWQHKYNPLMLELIRTNSDNSDFQLLVRDLDLELKIRDGEDHAFYAQYNKTDSIKYVVLAYENSEAVGCGAIKEWNSETMEVKRMFVPLKNRGKGIASFVLKELEHWAKELGYKKCILETGEKQPEAIQLYTKNNYNLIPNYGQYAGVEASKCFEKYLS
jgi:putative acetyltransferase